MGSKGILGSNEIMEWNPPVRDCVGDNFINFHVRIHAVGVFDGYAGVHGSPKKYDFQRDLIVTWPCVGAPCWEKVCTACRSSHGSAAPKHLPHTITIPPLVYKSPTM